MTRQLICDRCHAGPTLLAADYDGWITTNVHPDNQVFFTLDLCPRCADALRRWINEGV